MEAAREAAAELDVRVEHELRREAVAFFPVTSYGVFDCGFALPTPGPL